MIMNRPKHTLQSAQFASIVGLPTVDFTSFSFSLFLFLSFSILQSKGPNDNVKKNMVTKPHFFHIKIQSEVFDNPML